MRLSNHSQVSSNVVLPSSKKYFTLELFLRISAFIAVEIARDERVLRTRYATSSIVYASTSDVDGPFAEGTGARSE
jgi:hypothetical protein